MTRSRTPTSTPETNPPSDIAGDGGAKLRLVGPTMHGWVYRATQGTTYCLALPVERVPLAWKQEVRKRAGEVAAGRVSRVVNHVVNPIRAGQEDVGDYYLVRYDPGEPTQPLAELLTGRTERPIFSERIIRSIFERLQELGRLGEELQSLPMLLSGNSPGLRVMATAWVLRAVSRWWQQGIPVLPMPAQVLFNAEGHPMLLGGTPYLPVTRVEPLFAEPQRILYLPPELIGSRGVGAWDWQRVDRYGLGVFLHQCIYPPAEIANPENALHRAVNGTLLEWDRRRGPSPFWLDRMPAFNDVRNWIQRLTATNLAVRSKENLDDLGRVVEVCGQRLTPSIAVRELVESDTPAAGFALLQQVLITEESYEYLELAAKTARAVERPLEALDLLERAINRNSTRPDARLERIMLLRKAPDWAALIQLYETDAPRFDGIIWNDFNALDGQFQEDARPAMADYLVWRGQYQLAAQRIYDWLFDKDGQYRWYDMDLNRAFARASLGLVREAICANAPDDMERLSNLKAHLNNWREWMKTLRIKSGMDFGELYEYGESLEAISIEVYEIEQRLLTRPHATPEKIEEQK